jgi:hypothetical protein
MDRRHSRRPVGPAHLVLGAGLVFVLVLVASVTKAAGEPRSPVAKAPATARLRVSGSLVQGGVLVGSTVPGAHVAVDGRVVRVGEDGTFIFGLGRDAGPRASLVVTLPDGHRLTRALTIRRRRYRVQRIDRLPQAMVTPPEEMMPRILAERTRLAALWGVDSDRPLFKSGFIRPAKGPVTGVYGSRRILNGEPRDPHWGVDFAAPEGAPVVAPADGIVLLAQPDMYYTGGTVLLDHGFGLISAFLHLSAIDVAVGQQLAQGDPIGRVGATGRATGPHLDWRVRWFETFVDPLLLPPTAKP